MEGIYCSLSPSDSYKKCLCPCFYFKRRRKEESNRMSPHFQVKMKRFCSALSLHVCSDCQKWEQAALIIDDLSENNPTSTWNVVKTIPLLLQICAWALSNLFCALSSLYIPCPIYKDTYLNKSCSIFTSSLWLPLLLVWSHPIRSSPNAHTHVLPKERGWGGKTTLYPSSSSPSLALFELPLSCVV